MRYSVLESQLLNFDFEVFPSSSSINLLASKDILQSRVFSQNADELHEESRICQEESIDISMFLGRQKEAVLCSASFNESRQVEIEHNLAMESLRSLCQMDQENVDVDETLADQESTEIYKDDESRQKEMVHHDQSSVEESIEEHCIEGNLEFQKKVSFEDGQSSNPAESTMVDATPQSKLQAGSIGRPKPGL